MTEEPNSPRLSPLATLIFSSRWLQLPLYLGLIIAQGVYVILFILSALGIAYTDRVMLGDPGAKSVKH